MHETDNYSANIRDLIFSVPARVLRPDAGRQAELMAVIADRHVLDPSILEEHQLFFWDAEISSDLIDSHFTHMLPNTLANFRLVFEPKFMNTVIGRMDANEAIFKRILDDDDFRDVLADFYLKKMYARLRSTEAQP